ncbi:MAG: glutamate--tRNA ligase [Candidatus Pacearchaeota archaeon]
MNKELIRAYALKNAIEHEGKANPKSVLNSLFAEGLKREDIDIVYPLVEEIVTEVNSSSSEKQKEDFEKLKSLIHQRKTRKEDELPELEGAIEGKVVMRIAPFPSGPLHIGNTRALILNSEFVKKYKGKFILFFDDTIGSEDKQIVPEAYDLIKEGVEWLGIKPDEVYYKSDRFEIYYDYADELIKKGYMYVCSCSQEEFQRIKEKGIECACRNLSPEKSYERWKKMFSRTTKEGEFVVRLKTSMQDPDPAFRDRVMLKIATRPHPRTKKKYKVYPSMEFSWAIDDYLIGTTHVLRGIEHQMSTKVQDFIRKIFNWPNPISLYLGLFQIEGVKISKSKGAKEVKEGRYIGWNDPRLWSLQSLRDRGIKPEAIKKFIISQGLDRKNVKVPIEVLYSINRKMLDECPRYFFIKEPVKIKIENAPNLKINIPIHPSKNLGFKNRDTFNEFFIEKKDYEEIKEGEEIRLMHLFNFRCYKISPNGKKEFIFSSQEPKSKIKIIHWIPSELETSKVKVLLEDGSLIEGIADPEVKNLNEQQQFQFERFGFVKIYKKEKEFLECWFTHR